MFCVRVFTSGLQLTIIFIITITNELIIKTSGNSKEAHHSFPEACCLFCLFINSPTTIVKRKAVNSRFCLIIDLNDFSIVNYLDDKKSFGEPDYLFPKTGCCSSISSSNSLQESNNSFSILPVQYNKCLQYEFGCMHGFMCS